MVNYPFKQTIWHLKKLIVGKSFIIFINYSYRANKMSRVHVTNKTKQNKKQTDVSIEVMWRTKEERTASEKVRL